jgi:hypothetical protein
MEDMLEIQAKTDSGFRIPDNRFQVSSVSKSGIRNLKQSKPVEKVDEWDVPFSAGISNLESRIENRIIP